MSLAVGLVVCVVVGCGVVSGCVVVWVVWGVSRSSSVPGVVQCACLSPAFFDGSPGRSVMACQDGLCAVVSAGRWCLSGVLFLCCLFAWGRVWQWWPSGALAFSGRGWGRCRFRAGRSRLRFAGPGCAGASRWLPRFVGSVLLGRARLGPCGLSGAPFGGCAEWGAWCPPCVRVRAFARQGSSTVRGHPPFGKR